MTALVCQLARRLGVFSPVDARTKLRQAHLGSTSRFRHLRSVASTATADISLPSTVASTCSQGSSAPGPSGGPSISSSMIHGTQVPWLIVFTQGLGLNSASPAAYVFAIAFISIAVGVGALPRSESWYRPSSPATGTVHVPDVAPLM